MIVEDDLIGRKAIESLSLMDKTIEYHKLMVGAFENEEALEENDELVIGNRWGFKDLNSHVREYEPEFRVTTHSALGGCCDLHPPDQAIFPEEFNEVKLERWRRRLGNYLFSCQFLNKPVTPENADFHLDDLRFFSLEKDLKNGIEEWTIHHEVTNGVIKKNLTVNHLNLCLVADPNHSGNSGSGRCRHAINVVGLSSDGDFYLIDTWAQAASYDTFYAKIYEFSDKWKIRKLGVESVAAQKYILHHIDFTNRLEGRNLKVIPLKGEVETEDGEVHKKKEFRIRGVLSPILETHKFWAQRKQQDFLGELTAFPVKDYTRDILDALAYAPQMLRLPAGFIKDMMWRAANAAGARKINMPYSTGV
jgi:hypothetical protein